MIVAGWAYPWAHGGGETSRRAAQGGRGSQETGGGKPHFPKYNHVTCTFLLAHCHTHIRHAPHICHYCHMYLLQLLDTLFTYTSHLFLLYILPTHTKVICYKCFPHTCFTCIHKSHNLNTYHIHVHFKFQWLLATLVGHVNFLPALWVCTFVYINVQFCPLPFYYDGNLTLAGIMLDRRSVRSARRRRMRNAVVRRNADVWRQSDARRPRRPTSPSWRRRGLRELKRRWGADITFLKAIT